MGLLEIDEALLDAFIAGELSAESRQQVAARLESDPELLNYASQGVAPDFLEKLRQARRALISTRESGQRNLGTQPESSRGTDPGSSRRRQIAKSGELIECPGYSIVRELSRGGMGVVYLAKNLPMDRLEVLKVLSARLWDHEGAKARFLREIRAISKLNHPNIVIPYNVLELDDRLVLAMEYVPGLDLQRFIQKYRLPVELACGLARQIAAGLQHAHERGLIHRDIKPSNVMISKADGQLKVKILDFGLAKTDSQPSLGNLTVEGTFLGTPEYAAPEQAINAAKADIRADIYSLGCTLYCMLAGHPPFRGTSAEVLLAHVLQEPTRVDLIRPDVPVDLASEVARMMAKDPAQRYQHPAEVISALAPFVGNRQHQAHFSTDDAARPLVLQSSLPHGPIIALSASASASKPAADPIQPAVEDAIPVTQGNDFNQFPSRQRRRPRLANRTLIAVKARLVSARRGVFALVGAVTALAAIWLGVLTIRTPDGILIFEGLPKGADVSVDGSIVSVSFDDSQQQAICFIKPGSYQVEVRFNDVTIEGERVSIASGKETVMTVRVARPQETSTPSSPSIAASDLLRTVPAEVAGPFPLKFEELGTIGELSAGPNFPLAYSRFGDVFAVGDGSTIRIWDIGRPGSPSESWRQRQEAQILSLAPTSVLSLGFTPSGDTLLFGTNRGEVHEIKAGSTDNTAKLILQTSRPGIVSLAVSSDGQRLATGHANGEFALWNLATREQLHSGEQKVSNAAFPQINSLSFSMDDQFLVIGGPRLELRDVDTWRQHWERRPNAWSHWSACLTQDGRYVLTVGRSGESHHYSIVQVDDGISRGVVGDGLAGAEALTIYDGGQLIVTGDSSGVLRVWDRSEGELPAPLLAEYKLASGRPVRSLGVNDLRRYVLAGCDQGSVTVLRVVQADEADEHAAHSAARPEQNLRFEDRQRVEASPAEASPPQE